MSKLANQLRLFYLFHLAKPASDRPIHRAVYELQARTVMEIGLGRGQRALRLIELAGRSSPLSEVRYVGIDFFELALHQGGSSLCLKDAYRLLRKTQAQIQLLPGDPLTVLAKMANWLKPVDILVVSAAVDHRSMDRAWFYIPRILHSNSLIFQEFCVPKTDRIQVRTLAQSQVEKLANAAMPRRAA